MSEKKTGSKEKLYSSYLFTGEADSRRETEFNKITAQVLDPDFKIFDLERFDGDSASASDIISAVTTLPMGPNRKVAVVERVDRLSNEDQAKIADVLPRLSDRSCLIMLTAEGASSKKKAAKDQSDDDDTDGKTRSKGLGTKLSNAVKSNGKILNFAKLKARDISAIVSEMARKHGKKIEPAAQETVARISESNLASVEREIEKLVLYIGDRDTITVSDVDKLIPKPAEDRVFPLIDAVAAGQSDLAIQLLNETFTASMKPEQDVLKIISLLARHFRMLYQTKHLLLQPGIHNFGMVPEEQAMLLPREQNPLSLPSWQQDKLILQSKYFKLNDIELSMKLILSCELAAKGVGNPAGSSRLNLEVLIYRLCQRKSIPLSKPVSG